ncbi:Deaminase [Phytophthora cactorum]|nr:Deaminase [Phytophthora cactorum]
MSADPQEEPEHRGRLAMSSFLLMARGRLDAQMPVEALADPTSAEALSAAAGALEALSSSVVPVDEPMPMAMAVAAEESTTDDEELQQFSMVKLEPMMGAPEGSVAMELVYEDVVSFLFNLAREQNTQQLHKGMRTVRKARNADELLPRLLTAEDETGLTLLMIGVRGNDRVLCNMLLDAGADVNFKTVRGCFLVDFHATMPRGLVLEDFGAEPTPVDARRPPTAEVLHVDALIDAVRVLARGAGAGVQEPETTAVQCPDGPNAAPTQAAAAEYRAVPAAVSDPCVTSSTCCLVVAASMHLASWYLADSAMEFLVHNISHSDLVVELSWLREDGAAAGSNGATVPTASQPVASVDVDGASVPLSVLGRPKFSLFQQTSQHILERVQQLRHPKRETKQPTHAAAVLSVPDGPETPSLLHPTLLGISSTPGEAWTARCQDTQSSIGFNLADAPIPISKEELLTDFQLRGEVETTRLVEKHWDRVGITAVYFPLVALLLPKWTQVLNEFQSEGSRQLMYLISGAGIPRNVEHSHSGNSTEITAQLIVLFVHQYYPHMTAIQVHSGSNIFRFDDNVQFMTRELRPLLEAHRETLVDRCGEAWKSHFHVTIAYADGPPARLSALNASLRMYRPSYLHIWQLKTFWHQRKLSMADVDFHSFENIEASPLVAPGKADALTQMIVREMRKFRDQFLSAEGEGEVAGFWLRKSRKPVLAVLLIEKPAADIGGRPTIVVQRGMNCEVSMPTGSLCAERNAIGSALASDPTLTRRALKMIAVLGLNLTAGGAGSSVTSPTASEDTGDDAKKKEPSHGAKATSTSTATAELVGPTNPQVLPVRVRPASVQSSLSSAAVNHSTPAQRRADAIGTGRGRGRGRGKRELETKNANLTSPRKPKRPRTFSFDEVAVEEMMRASAPPDRNPLAPCGACKEWLVKIAEANPSFRVVTFENSRCRNIYINQLM